MWSLWCWSMCSGVPSVFRCLVDAMEGCSSSGGYWRINETIEMTLRNMSAFCPQSCDPATGHNCSLNYYDRVVMSFVDGVDCPILGRCDNCHHRQFIVNSSSSSSSSLLLLIIIDHRYIWTRGNWQINRKKIRYSEWTYGLSQHSEVGRSLRRYYITCRSHVCKSRQVVHCYDRRNVRL